LKLITAFVICLFPCGVQANINNNINNDVIQICVQNNSDYNKAASCYFKWKNQQIAAERAELRDFLEANPRYRVPGQSLNRCWGKPREMPFESSYLKVGPNGMEAGVNYKDTIPAGCYENAPWDNRDEN
jgi:hypothetical protein